MDAILPQVPLNVLRSFQSKLGECKEFHHTVYSYYLNFLIELYSRTELSIETTQFIHAYPLKLLAGYRNVSQQSPVCAKAHFELASWYISKEHLKPEELKRSVITDLDHESPRQVKLANAFYHACHWFHFQTEEKSKEPNSFIRSLVRQIFFF